MKNTKALAYINSLKLETFRKANKDQLKDMIHFLNRECGITFKYLSQVTGIGISTLHNYASPPKKDATQKTNRLLKRDLDVDVLIRYFKVYIPRDSREREEIKQLALVLMDCSKR